MRDEDDVSLVLSRYSNCRASNLPGGIEQDSVRRTRPRTRLRQSSQCAPVAVAAGLGGITGMELALRLPVSQGEPTDYASKGAPRLAHWARGRAAAAAAASATAAAATSRDMASAADSAAVAPDDWPESDPEYDLRAWLEEIGVGVPALPVYDTVHREVERKGYSRDEILDLQAQFQRFAGFMFDRADALEAALEARRKIFLQAEMELARRNAEEAKARQEVARAAVEKRRQAERRERDARGAALQRHAELQQAQRAAQQRRQELELRARKVESLRQNIEDLRAGRGELAAMAQQSRQRTSRAAAYAARVSVARHALLGHTSPPTVTVPFAEWHQPDDGIGSAGHLYLTVRRVEEPGAYTAFERYTEAFERHTMADPEGDFEDTESDVEGMWLRDGSYRGWKRWRHEGGGYWLRRRHGMNDWRIVDGRTDESAQGYPAVIRTLFVCRPKPGCVIDASEPSSPGHVWHGTGVWAAPPDSGGNAPGVWSTTRLWPTMRLQFTPLPPPAVRTSNVRVPTAQPEQQEMYTDAGGDFVRYDSGSEPNGHSEDDEDDGEQHEEVEEEPEEEEDDEEDDDAELGPGDRSAMRWL